MPMKVHDNMTNQEIYNLASLFKSTLLTARDLGVFDGDIIFNRFPKGCCGDTCYLLAFFLKEYGIETIYVWGNYGRQSHAWLVVKDDRVKKPTSRYTKVGNEYAEFFNKFGIEVPKLIENNNYVARDLTNGLIIDITADQFGEPSVYVGKRNTFYRKYTFRDAHICIGLNNRRLENLYNKISSFLP